MGNVCAKTMRVANLVKVAERDWVRSVLSAIRIRHVLKATSKRPAGRAGRCG